MFTKNQLSSISKGVRYLALLAMLAATLLATPALAEGNGTVLTIERLKGSSVGIKIVFPDNASANLNVFINGVKMNCKSVAQDTIYCIGPLRAKDFGSLSIYDGPSQTATFFATVTGPAKNDQELCIPRPSAAFISGTRLQKSAPVRGNWCAPFIFPF